ncbi:family 43 glycosylhydrolase [Streptomyces sp. NPDC051907]|uniref:family 43 glycosylhydrolase n=1 Tax=Streptomyces sp. NPDC051907 TaxID=3155284 RepID=UPI0034404B37
MHRRTAARRLERLVALVVCGLALAMSLAAAPAGAAAGGPVLDQDFPDPDLLAVNGTYHAYATNAYGRNIQHATSRDLVDWTVDEADVLPVLGAWASVEPRGKVWAPEVFDNGDGYTLQYTARDRASGKQCIGAALSSSPDGPFRPVGDGPLVCPVAQDGAIDAGSYTEDGRRYVLWKNDANCCSKGETWLHLQQTTPDGARTTGEPVRLVKQDRDWEGELVEAPTLVKRAGHYVLFYSADAYVDERYKTSYAVADRLTGPYTKAAAPLMTTASFSGTVVGPGGQDVVTGPDGRDRIVFHGWRGDGARHRAMYVADLGFANGLPVVRGSKVLYQAENARVHNALVRDAVGAGDGRAVGHIDHPDSYVEFAVFAASAGAHTLSVRFGNGSLDGAGSPAAASHRLSVNGRDAGVVAYPHTGWDRWDTVQAALTLRDGWNTVRLAKGELYTELDSIDVA